jgi:hypothetical protein
MGRKPLQVYMTYTNILHTATTIPAVQADIFLMKSTWPAINCTYSAIF